jgi:hypothetical protein
MSGTSVLLFAAAVGVLFVAHVVRALRHSFLFSKGELAERFDLLLALSFTYALNTLLPLRIGEIARVLFIAARLRLRVPYVAATVIAERVSDMVVVAGISAAIAMSLGGPTPAARTSAIVLGAAALVAIVGALLVQRAARVRRLVWRLASIFNETIKVGLVECVWTVSQLLTEGPILTARFLTATLGMWTLYLTAFWLFATSVGVALSEVSFALLGAPLQPLFSELFAGGMSRTNIALLAFTSVPIGVVICYGLVRNRREIGRSLRFMQRFGLAPAQLAPPPISRRFRNTDDYALLLVAHFTATNQIVSAFAAEGMEDAVVHRLLPGGSDAVTAVVEVAGALSIRKLAAANAGKKLRVQAQWLRAHEDALSLAHVIGERQLADRYHYDMPFSITARDFYDVIHTASIETSKTVLRGVVEDMARFHEAHALGTASDAVVDAYLEQKVVANVRNVLSYARVAVGNEYVINGEPHRLGDWDCLLDMDWLRAQIRSRHVSSIHGDLTIENIIVCPDRPKGWYIIDPNPENVLDTPLIDWAKLMQSLNLGYEGLNRGGGTTVSGDVIQVALTKSNAYAQLDTFLTSLLESRLGAEGMREVAFHELVNYLRLTPYKIRHAPQKGLAFFACTSILLRRYREATGA